MGASRVDRTEERWALREDHRVLQEAMATLQKDLQEQMDRATRAEAKVRESAKEMRDLRDQLSRERRHSVELATVVQESFSTSRGEEGDDRSSLGSFVEVGPTDEP